MTPLSEYESSQVAAIAAWKEKSPGVVSKSLGTVSAPITWLAEKVIPELVIRKAINTVDFAANWLADSRSIQKDAQVDQIAELRTKDLKLSDDLAGHIHTWAIGMATAEGTAAGLGGMLTLSADMPAVVILALRTIYEVGLCYGFEFENKADRQFILGVLAVSSANSMGDKKLVLEKLRGIELTALAAESQALQAMPADSVDAEPVRGKQKSMPRFDISSLAKTVGMNLTKRKALQMIPVVGAVVGGSVNGWFIKDTGWAARRCFQQRWLIENHKLEG